MANVHKKLFLFSFFLIFILFFDIGWAYAGSKTLMINPVRVVFEGRTRTATVHVSNTNSEPIKYRISLVTLRKNAEGKLAFVENETEEDKFVQSMIRFSPRQATIEPGTRQVVKLMVRKPADLPEGEYQTRIRFMPLADQVSSSTSKNNVPAKSQINIDLLVGVTIPVVIQHGKVKAAVSPAKIVLQKHPQIPSGLAAIITLSRSGSYSAFGDVVVSHIAGSDKTLIGKGESVGIYIPDVSRTFAIPLQSLEKVDFTKGKLRVEFSQHSQNKRTPVISYRDFNLVPRD